MDGCWAGVTFKLFRVDQMNNQEDERGLDHLMEQNSTELGFLDVYGSDASMSNDEILRMMSSFLTKQSVEFSINKGSIDHEFGSFRCLEEGGVRFQFNGKTLPLVPSDFEDAQIANGLLHQKKGTSGELHTWDSRTARFFARLIEFHRLE